MPTVTECLKIVRAVHFCFCWETASQKPLGDSHVPPQHVRSATKLPLVLSSSPHFPPSYIRNHTSNPGTYISHWDSFTVFKWSDFSFFSFPGTHSDHQSEFFLHTGLHFLCWQLSWVWQWRVFSVWLTSFPQTAIPGPPGPRQWCIWFSKHPCLVFSCYNVSSVWKIPEFKKSLEPSIDKRKRKKGTNKRKSKRRPLSPVFHEAMPASSLWPALRQFWTQ